MSFRRPAHEAQDRARWRAFVHEHEVLFRSAGLPAVMSEDRRRFDYFLGHGDLQGDLADAGTVRLDDLTVEQRGALGLLVQHYLASELSPGWGVEPGIARLAPPATGPAGTYP